jgi:thiol-disulfide isomerase/thioredoxin
MKKTFICVLLTFVLTPLLWAQTASVHVTVANTSSSACVFVRTEQTFMRDFLKKGYTEIALNNHKTATYTIQITKPEFITFYCDSSSTREGKSLHYSFFISPGDDLDFKADFARKDFGITVTGKGNNNNQPLRRTFFSADFEQFNKDTLPNRMITAINDTAKRIGNTFKTYVEQYRPSAAFIKYMQYNIDYYATQTFYNLKENNKFALEDAYYRNIAKWQHVTDSLFSRTKLDNADALPVPNYRSLTRYFLLRKKEALWRESTTDSVAFFKDWYNANVTEGRKAFMDDRSNLLQEKIINKYFTGDVAEYLYAILFDDAFAEANPANVVAIFNRFKQKYPNSIYINWFSPSVENVIKKSNNSLSNEMVFAKDNGTQLNTLEDIQELAKGKTVLLDMWGTWCGPCRKEMENNSDAIKDHFKNKGLDYFYVANYDLKNETNWKKLIAYFKLTGTHVLANERLSDDIMKKTKGRGYPTYIIIKKDGSYELSKAGYPMDRGVLIKQLEDALAIKN